MSRIESREHTLREPMPTFMLLATMVGSLAILILSMYGSSKLILLIPLALLIMIVIARSPGFSAVSFTIIIYMNTAAVLADSHGIRVFGDLVALLMLLTASYYFLRGRRTDQIVVPLIICLIYLISLAATALYARDPSAVLVKVFEGAKICIITILLISLVNSIEQFQRMCMAVVIAASLMSLLTILQYRVTGYSNDFGGFALANIQNVSASTDDWRPSGPLTDPNFYAQILVIALPLALQLIISGHNKLYILFGLFSSILISSVLLLTLSRGGLIGAAASLVIVILVNRKAITKKHIYIAVILGCLGLLAMPSRYTERFVSGFNSLIQVSTGRIGEDPAIAGRASELLAAWHLAQQNPVLGVGYGEFKSYYQQISLSEGLMARGNDREAHSLYLQILSERGFIGVLIFAALMTLSLASIRKAALQLHKQRRAAAANMVSAWGAAIVGYLVTSIFLHESYAQYFWLIVMTSLILPALAGNSKSASNLRDR